MASDGYADLVRAIAGLYAGTPKQVAERPFLAPRFVFRPISFAVTPVFVRAGFGPNQVTAISLILTVGALGCLAVGRSPWIVSGAALYFLAAIVDYCDGNVARYRGVASLYGKLIDGLVDTVGLLHFAALGIGLSLTGAGVLAPPLDAALGVGLTLLLVFAGEVEVRYKALSLEAGAARPDPPSASDGRGGPTAAAKAIVGGIFYNWIFAQPLLLLAAMLAGAPSAYLVASAVVHVSIVPLRVAHILRRARRVLDVRDRRSDRIP